jgi:hypothetical protein
MPEQPSREDSDKVMFNPLSYITPDQKKIYRGHILRKAFMFIVIGLLTLLAYSYLYNHGIDINTLSFPYPGKPNLQRWYEAYWLALFGLMFGCPLYGLYLLATTRRQMAKSALNDLAIQNASVKERLDERLVEEAEDLNNKVNLATNVLIKIFIGTIAIVVLFTLVVIGLAITGKLSNFH